MTTGASAIGDPGMGEGERLFAPFDISQTIMSQYANSPVLLTLTARLAEYFDASRLAESFFDNLWNIDTAKGRGLDNWGRIVGMSRILFIPITASYFGFGNSTSGRSFGESPFYYQQDLTTNYALSDDSYRKLILAKALANITNGSIASINAILMALFSQYGNCYVIDNGDMTMVYRFTGTLSAVDYAIVTQSNVLPRPAGVTATIVQG